MDNKEKILEIYLEEYGKLKEEQIQRIGFRDNMIYITLGLFGGVLSFALSNKMYYSLLIIPWVCITIGWTYLINDEKISAIGRYIRSTLTEKIKAKIEGEDILAWEIAHRSDVRRKRRKIEQLVVDLITFIASGMAAILAFWFLESKISLPIQILCGIELILLLILAIEIILYADLKTERES